MPNGVQAEVGPAGGGFDAYRLAGRGWTLGEQHGRSVGPQARRFIADRLLRLNALLDAPTSLQELGPVLGEYHAVIARELPTMAREIEGFAEGAGISLPEAVLLQVRREILGFSRVHTRGDCTTFARVSPSDAVLAQTVDLNGDLEREGYVLRIRNAGRDGRELVLLTFTGLTGYLGMNSHGLAIGLNLVLAGRWSPGIPAYMAIRYLLEHATNVRECKGLLEPLTLASSRSFTICDTTTAANVEMARGEFRWQWGETLVHTNHFLDAGLSGHDELNVFARNGSVGRLRSCRALLQDLDGRPGIPEYFSVLEDPEISAPPGGGIRREVTVARVVMKPRERRFVVKRGAQRDAPTQVFQLGASS